MFLSNDNSGANALDLAKLRATFKAENYDLDGITDTQFRNMFSFYDTLKSHSDSVKLTRDLLGYVKEVVKPQTNMQALRDDMVFTLMVRNECYPKDLSSKSSNDEVIACINKVSARQNGTNVVTESIDFNTLRAELKAMYPNVDWDSIPDDELMAMLDKAQLDSAKAGTSSKKDIYNRIYQLAIARKAVAQARRKEAFY